ncbi:MAG: DNA replication/repair protein RecF [Chlamydiia bacterium]|nr:DNA replication/repair protein RecF [Chlamydiia bacterium]
MQLKGLYIRNFRNIADEEITFAPGCNVIFGENAQGKTNLLEAIILLSIGRSFRTSHLSELIREKEAAFYLEAEGVREGISHHLKLSFDGQTKRLHIDGNTYAHFNPLLGLFPSVVHAPRDVELVSGAPSERRRFLDLALAQSEPLYVHHLSRFYRAMKQRNCLLRSQIWDAIDCWEAEMAQAATQIQKMRTQLIASLSPALQKEGKALSHGQECHEMVFSPSYPATGEGYLEQLQKNRRRDSELKLTATGPHRDDFSFLINGKLARIFASEGQKKTATAALKLAEWQELSKKIDALPLFAIDDLGQPLDPVREKHFCQMLEKLGQGFITTPKKLDIGSHGQKIKIARGCRVVHLPEGAELIHKNASPRGNEAPVPL